MSGDFIEKSPRRPCKVGHLTAAKSHQLEKRTSSKAGNAAKKSYNFSKPFCFLEGWAGGLGSRELSRYTTRSPPASRPSSGFSRIQFVVFVILGTLQGQLKCEAILGNLVDPYSRGNFGCSRIGSALLTCLSRCVALC